MTTTDLRLDVIPAMKVVLDRIQERHDRHTSMVVADALLDLLHLLHSAEQDLSRAREFLGAGL